MKISIKDITSQIKATEYPVQYNKDTFTFSGEEHPIDHIEPFDICLSMSGKKLHISGDSKVSIICSCDRCLSDVKITVPVSIDEEIQIEDGEVVTDEDIGPYPFVDGEDLDIDELIYDEILVNFPAKILCQDDCKGLCPVCGQNRNLVDCGCDDTVLDPRMAQFQDVFNSFKEV